jgi:glutaconate CoA-transferase subunit A
MIDKVIGLRQAAELVPPTGCRLAFGGVTLYRRPMAFVLALLERHVRDAAPNDLELVCFTAGVESDLLVGAKMVSSVRSCYFGLEVFGFAPHYSAAAAAGELKIIDESEASLAAGLRASLGGIGFVPSQAWIGTDMPKLRPDVKTVLDPYSGKELMAFPAIEIDLAVIHALEADAEGNALIGGNHGVDPELALVAETVVVTAEKISPGLEKADIVAPAVDAVVLAPSGAWPTSCHPLYPLDGLAILDYTEKAGTDGYGDLLDDWQRRHGPGQGSGVP